MAVSEQRRQALRHTLLLDPEPIYFKLLSRLPIVHPLSTFRLLWDLITSVCALITMILPPLWWAFYKFPVADDGDSWSPQPFDGSDGFSICETIVFVLAPLVNIRTAILDKGQLLHSQADIWHFYIRSLKLYCDVLGALAGPLRMCDINLCWLCLARVRGIMEFKTKIEGSTWLSKRNFQALTVLLTILLSLHWVSCVWVALAAAEKDERTWYRWLTSFKGETTHEPQIAYLWAVYWTFTTVSTCGFGDIVVTSKREATFMIVLLLLSILLYSGLIGVLSAFFVNSDAAYTQHKLRVETTKAFLHNHHFPQQLQYRVLTYLDYLWGATKGLNEERIIADLPETLQMQVRVVANDSVLTSVPLFEDTDPETAADIVRLLVSRTYLPNDILVNEGDESREMFIIRRGVVEVLAPRGQGASVYLSAGAYFGDVGVILGFLRTNTVRAFTHCHVYLMDRKGFDIVLMKYPACIDNMLNKMRGYSEWRLLQRELIKRVHEQGNRAGLTSHLRS